MTDTAWQTVAIIAIGIGSFVVGVGSTLIKILSNHSKELAEAVLVQNDKITALKLEVVALNTTISFLRNGVTPPPAIHHTINT